MRRRRRSSSGSSAKMPSAKEFFKALRDWWKLVKAGADPIEAMHGHVCSPSCWHNQFIDGK